MRPTIGPGMIFLRRLLTSSRMGGASPKHPGMDNVISTMRYHDAAAAIKWLCQAFGFKKHLVVEAADDQIAHAQLTYGQGMIMLGSHRDDEFGDLVRPPDGHCTQSIYVVVSDADAHYHQAVDAGAEILVDIKDEPYGGRGYTCRDPEGHVWNFGTYDPWKEVE